MKETESIRVLKGVGEKTEKLFQKIGVVKYRWEICSGIIPGGLRHFQNGESIGTLKDQEKGAIIGTITENIDVKRVRNLTVISTVIADVTGKCRLTWFNMPFLRNTLKRGMTMVFRGKMAVRNNQRVMEQPEIYTPAAYQQKLNGIQPVRPYCGVHQ